jgi:hypothetical protein
MNPKIIDYRLLTADFQTDLTTTVSNYIDVGWQPYGFPYTFLLPKTQTIQFAQAVVKYE